MLKCKKLSQGVMWVVGPGVLCLLLHGQAASGDTIHVDVNNCLPASGCQGGCPTCAPLPPTGCENCPDGSSANPFCTIQEGIDCAQNGDTVLVHQGTYTGSGNRHMSWSGKNISVMGNSGASNTIIDLQTSSSLRAFSLDDATLNTKSVIKGFTIRNSTGVTNGGAIRVRCGGPTITKCVFDNNAAGNGGAIAIDPVSCSPQRKVVVYGNQFILNEATGSNAAGGAIYVWGGTVDIGASKFTKNKSDHDGGAIYLADATVKIATSVFTTSSAISEGGAIKSSSSYLSIDGSKVVGNTATGSILTDGHGGGSTSWVTPRASNSSSPTP